MRPTLTLTRLDQLRALADPLRLRIIQALTQRELSVAELAKQFRVSTPRLYHHIDLMLAAGVIEVTRRVPKRGTEERYLRATAKDYTLDRSLIAGAENGEQSVEALLDIVKTLFGSVQEELTRRARSGAIDPRTPARSVLVYDQALMLAPAGFKAIGREVPERLAAIAKRSSASRKGRHRIVMLAYPLDEADDE
jgi:DNA-binding transcriptional ArsR family regulator